MEMKMSKVKECSVKDCAYNSESDCHAMSITIGEPTSEAKCDTYFHSDDHGGIEDATAGVGACKTSDCKYNEKFECAAPEINVGYKGSQPDCLTFAQR